MAISLVNDKAAQVALNLLSPSARGAPAVTADSAAKAAADHTASMPSQAQVQQAIKTVQEMVQSKASNLQFSVDKESGRAIVTVVDSNTNEVIRQIPSKEMIAIAHAIDQMEGKDQGLILSQKA